MIEITFLGRAGQGAKSGAQLIAEAAVLEKKYVQAFSEFGAERLGAPVKAYVRISKNKINTKQPIEKADILVVIDKFLWQDSKNLVKESGIMIINTTKSLAEIKKTTKHKGCIYKLDATSIAIKHLTENRSNIPMLGALIKITKVIKLESMKKVIHEMFHEKIGPEKTNQNMKALEDTMLISMD